ncbi:MAG: zinc ribbon domain-containing protein [Candidatus Schekmanbacteria bacterium]|nr:MAG: zinc ribbon domain-containing protein [Candidatus Schekmanbacteria bacterium]
MPIYEYQCDDCGFKFEVFKKINENGNEVCPECNSKKVNRLISPGGFILKGSGWYITDYPSESRKKAMEAEKKAASSSSSDNSNKKESKKSDK